MEENIKKVGGLLTSWMRIKLFFFGERIEFWDHQEGMVSVWRVYKGTKYLLHMEPMAYGDPRLSQISRISWIR